MSERFFGRFARKLHLPWPKSQEAVSSIPPVKERWYNAYEKMTPQERNNEFRQIYLSFPPKLEDGFSIRDSDTLFDSANPAEAIIEVMDYLDAHPEIEEDNKIAEALINRENSEYNRVVMERLDVLLSFAPITDTLAGVLKDELFLSYNGGVDRDHPRLNRLSQAFVFDEPESAGVFERETAKEIEKRGFEQLVDIVHVNRIKYERRGIFYTPLPDQKEKLEKWPSEYFVIHEEPIGIAS